jgi:hypothetical protein
MDTRYELLGESFTTADAECPHIVSEDGCLKVTFRDWREQLVTLLFHEVVAFSWDDGDAEIDSNHRDDCSYIVHESQWLARHRAKATVMPSDDHRHFKLCFNAVGVLQVLSSRLKVVAEPGAASEGGCS